ncbi:MAG: hypothetical protein K2L19_04900 [Eubacterium sp.]|nr:hypothetical protein [Eubacterium sp.]
MKQKSKLGKFNLFLLVVLVIALVANIVVISTKSVPVAADANANEAAEDVAVIDAFAAGTYGGVEFASIDDVVKYYADAYNKTKTQTREYIDSEGNTQVWYTMLGEEKLQVNQIMIEGKENSMINNLVPGIVGSLYSPGLNGLSPSSNRNPNEDKDDAGTTSLQTCLLTADDLLAANVKDNGDGTITLQLQPKQVNMSARGMDAQGRLFNSLGDIGGVVGSINVLSWAQGTTEENCLVDYRGGYATVTIDTASGLVTTADYHMEAHIAVNHANVAVIKDKSATLLVTYDVHYPASDDYLMETKGCKVK